MYLTINKNTLLELAGILEISSDSNGDQAHSLLVQKQTLKHLAWLAKWLSICF